MDYPYAMKINSHYIMQEVRAFHQAIRKIDRKAVIEKDFVLCCVGGGGVQLQIFYYPSTAPDKKEMVSEIL